METIDKLYINFLDIVHYLNKKWLNNSRYIDMYTAYLIAIPKLVHKHAWVISELKFVNPVSFL